MPIASRIPAVMLVMVAVVTLTSKDAVRAKCVPTTTRPDINSIQVENVASLYRGVVANMAGYLELFNSTGNSTYLPLDIKSVSVGQPDSLGVRGMTLSGECFRFELGYGIGTVENPSHYTYDFYGFDHMLVKNDANQEKAPKEICTFDQILNLRLDDNFRYSCKQILGHQCSLAKQPVASLVLKSFELDIDGHPANVKKGLFTERPLKNSCKLWNK